MHRMREYCPLCFVQVRICSCDDIDMKPTIEVPKTICLSKTPTAVSTLEPSGPATPSSLIGTTPKLVTSGPTSFLSGMRRSHLMGYGSTWANAHPSALEAVGPEILSITQLTRHLLYREGLAMLTTCTPRVSARPIPLRLHLLRPRMLLNLLLRHPPHRLQCPIYGPAQRQEPVTSTTHHT